MEHVAAIPTFSRQSPRSGLLHRSVNGLSRIAASLGHALFGIGEAPRRAPRRWWDEAEEPLPSAPSPPAAAPRAVSLPKAAAAPRQLSLDLSAGAAAAPRPVALPVPAAAPAAPRRLPETVGIAAANEGTLRPVVDLVSRPAAPAVPVTRPLVLRESERVATLANAVPQRGAVARQLVLSQSLSFKRAGEIRQAPAVPRTAVLPRFQLFAGVQGVTTDKDGSIRLPSRGQKARGNVFFV